MNNKLLYFPYINIPESSWTIKSLLYWDSVGIIVPPKFTEQPNRYDHFTVNLLQSDLIEQLLPSNFIYKIPNFDNGFIKLVNQPKFGIARRQLDFAKGVYSRIHFQKFGNQLLNRLVELDIARRENYEWYNVETRTANLIMLYLATSIGIIGEFTPATDAIENIDLSIKQRRFSVKNNFARQSLLDDLIPYPIEPNLTQLRRFKDRHHEELKSFRILLERAAFEISTSKFANYRQQRHNLIVAEIIDKKEKIVSDLNHSSIGQIAFGTICGIVGAAYGFSQEQKTLGIFSLANAIFSAFQGYDNSAILRRDYSYLALIDKSFNSNR
jgi:hypothetical protein